MLLDLPINLWSHAAMGQACKQWPAVNSFGSWGIASVRNAITAAVTHAVGEGGVAPVQGGKQTPHTRSHTFCPWLLEMSGLKIIPTLTITRIKLPPVISLQLQKHFSKSIQSTPGCTPPVWIMSFLLVMSSYFTWFQWVICGISSWEQLVTELAWCNFDLVSPRCYWYYLSSDFWKGLYNPWVFSLLLFLFSHACHWEEGADVWMLGCYPWSISNNTHFPKAMSSLILSWLTNFDWPEQVVKTICFWRFSEVLLILFSLSWPSIYFCFPVYLFKLNPQWHGLSASQLSKIPNDKPLVISHSHDCDSTARNSVLHQPPEALVHSYTLSDVWARGCGLTNHPTPKGETGSEHNKNRWREAALSVPWCKTWCWHLAWTSQEEHCELVECSIGGIGQDDFLADLVSGWTGRQLTAQLSMGLLCDTGILDHVEKVTGLGNVMS